MPFFDTLPLTNVYDSNVFDWSHHIMDIVPTFNKVIMEREFQLVKLGQAVTLLCNVQDIMTTPGQRFQFDPDNRPEIQVYNPDDTIRVAWATMNFVATGQYNYQLQTLGPGYTVVFDELVFDEDVFATETVLDVVGVYTAHFRAQHGTMKGITARVVVFEVIDV